MLRSPETLQKGEKVNSRAQTCFGGHFLRLVLPILGNSGIKQSPFKVSAVPSCSQAWVLGTGAHLLMSQSQAVSCTPRRWGLGTPLSSGARFKDRMPPGCVEREVTPCGTRSVRLGLPRLTENSGVFSTAGTWRRMTELSWYYSFLLSCNRDIFTLNRTYQKMSRPKWEAGLIFQ